VRDVVGDIDGEKDTSSLEEASVEPPSPPHFELADSKEIVNGMESVDQLARAGDLFSDGLPRGLAPMVDGNEILTLGLDQPIHFALVGDLEYLESATTDGDGRMAETHGGLLAAESLSIQRDTIEGNGPAITFDLDEGGLEPVVTLRRSSRQEDQPTDSEDQPIKIALGGMIDGPLHELSSAASYEPSDVSWASHDQQQFYIEDVTDPRGEVYAVLQGVVDNIEYNHWSWQMQGQFNHHQPGEGGDDRLYDYSNDPYHQNQVEYLEQSTSYMSPTYGYGEGSYYHESGNQDHPESDCQYYPDNHVDKPADTTTYHHESDFNDYDSLQKQSAEKITYPKNDNYHEEWPTDYHGHELVYAHDGHYYDSYDHQSPADDQHQGYDGQLTEGVVYYPEDNSAYQDHHSQPTGAAPTDDDDHHHEAPTTYTPHDQLPMMETTLNETRPRMRTIEIIEYECNLCHQTISGGRRYTCLVCGKSM